MAFSDQDTVIDGLQYINWDRERFEKTRDSGIHAVHVTIAYWETFRETVANISQWHRHFEDNADLIRLVRRAEDILEAKKSNRLGIIFGFQNCSPIDDDLGLIQILYELGARIMQLSYNNQSLLATGCYENNDPGITRFGKQAIAEMNRLGMVIDMSHSAEQSTLQAIELSEKPIAITHANPSFFHAALRNKSATVLKALSDSGGMLGFSVYPFHLRNGSECQLSEFCQMIAETADMMGVEHLGIGSDLCAGWGYETLEWMRSGRWTITPDHGEGSADQPQWPVQPDWFQDSSGMQHVAQGLSDIGFSSVETAAIMGGNWLRFFEGSFN